MTLFVDSSAYIALALKTEERHLSAVRFFENLEAGTRFLTSNFILGETITHLNARAGSERARHFAQEILRSARTTVLHLDLPIFHEALLMLKKYQDKRLSFTDLTSFALMRFYKIRQAFSFDSDFVKAGFEIVP